MCSGACTPQLEKPPCQNEDSAVQKKKSWFWKSIVFPNLIISHHNEIIMKEPFVAGSFPPLFTVGLRAAVLWSWPSCLWMAWWGPRTHPSLGQDLQTPQPELLSATPPPPARVGWSEQDGHNRFLLRLLVGRSGLPPWPPRLPLPSLKPVGCFEGWIVL